VWEDVSPYRIGLTGFGGMDVMLPLKRSEQEQANGTANDQPSSMILLPPYQAPIAQAMKIPVPMTGSHISAIATMSLLFVPFR
jgi:hypothetical protein